MAFGGHGYVITTRDRQFVRPSDVPQDKLREIARTLGVDPKALDPNDPIRTIFYVTNAKE